MSAVSKKIVLKRQLANLGLHPGHINLGLRLGLVLAENAGRTLLQPCFPIRDLVQMDIETVEPARPGSYLPSERPRPLSL
jgi:hypothetical protein